MDNFKTVTVDSKHMADTYEYNFMIMTTKGFDAYNIIKKYILDNELFVINELDDDNLDKTSRLYSSYNILDDAYPINAYKLYLELLKNNIFSELINDNLGSFINIVVSGTVLCKFINISPSGLEKTKNNFLYYYLANVLSIFNGLNVSNYEIGPIKNGIRKTIDVLHKLNTIQPETNSESQELEQYTFDYDIFDKKFIGGPLGVLMYSDITREVEKKVKYDKNTNRIVTHMPKGTILISHIPNMVISNDSIIYRLNFGLEKENIQYEKTLDNYYRSITNLRHKSYIDNISNTFTEIKMRNIEGIDDMGLLILDKVSGLKVVSLFTCIMDCIIEYIFYKNKSMKYFIDIGVQKLKKALIGNNLSEKLNMRVNLIFNVDDEFYPHINDMREYDDYLYKRNVGKTNNLVNLKEGDNIDEGRIESIIKSSVKNGGENIVNIE
jgi:hypothetical protein